MTIEQLLIYGAVAAGGWVLRHYGWFAANATVAPSTRSAPPAAVAPAVPGAIKQEIETIVRDTVQAATQAALNDLRQTVAPPAPAKP